MPKFAILGSYSAESWAGLIDKPTDRTEAIRSTVKSAGGSLEAFYLAMGEDDFLIIADMPDAAAAAAVSVATSSTGAVRHLRTISLLEWSAASALFAKAKSIRGSYKKPGT